MRQSSWILAACIVIVSAAFMMVSVRTPTQHDVNLPDETTVTYDSTVIERATTNSRSRRLTPTEDAATEPSATATTAAAASAKPVAPPPSAPPPAAAPVATPRPAAPTVADARAYAYAQIGATQFACLDALWQHESGWNPGARNPSSGAYGIPQALPAGKMASVAGDWPYNPITQVRWGLWYIGASYGTACRAWSFWLAHHWY
jgi:hypothetical protein